MAEWSAWDGDDWEQAEGDEARVEAGNKDSVIFLIDCNPHMFQPLPDGEGDTPFRSAVQCAMHVYQEKIISSDTDVVGLCFYATEHKRNKFEFGNIYMFHDLDVPDATRIKELDFLLDEDTTAFNQHVGHCKTPFPLNDALWTCQHMFAHLPKNFGFKRIFLFTNNENPPGPDGAERKRCIERARDLLESEITIELFPFRRPKGAGSDGSASGFSRKTSHHGSGSETGSASFSHSSLPGSSLEKGTPSKTSLSAIAAFASGGVSGLNSDSKSKGERGSESSVTGGTPNLWSPWGTSEEGSSEDPRYMPFDPSLFWKNLVFCGADEYTGSITFGAAQHFKEMLATVRKRTFKKRSACSLDLLLCPDMAGKGPGMAVQIFNPIMKATKAKHAWLDSETNRPTKTETRLMCQDTSAELTKDDVGYYVEYAGERVAFTKDEMTQIKTQFGKPAIRVVGFKPRKMLKIFHNVDHSAFIYPNEGSTKGSTAMFCALTSQMRAKNVFALAQIIPRANSQPRMCALLPQTEVVDGAGAQMEPPGMVVILLPYADEIREHELDPMQKAEDAQIKAAERVVKHLTIEFDSEEFENPALQKHYSVLQAMALDRSSVEETPDHTLPDVNGMKFHEGAIKGFKDSVFPEGYVPQASKTAPARGPDGEPLAKRPRTTPTADISTIDFPTLVANDNLESRNMEELKEYCRQHKLRVSGKKAELVERITQHILSPPPAGRSPSPRR